jgi:hypothetical protein
MSGHGCASEIVDDSRSRQLERATMFRACDFVRRQRTPGCFGSRRFLLLRFDGLRLPAAGHNDSTTTCHVLRATCYVLTCYVLTCHVLTCCGPGHVLMCSCVDMVKWLACSHAESGILPARGT